MNDDNKNPQNIESFNPDLKSVLGEIEEGRYLFIIVDRKKANMILFHKGEVETIRRVMNPGVAKQTKINSGELYGRNNKLAHHIENQIHQHLQLIMQETEPLFHGKHINGVFIGGHREFFNTIKNELPQILHAKLRGEFVTELNISEEELINHCKQVLTEYIK